MGVGHFPGKETERERMRRQAGKMRNRERNLRELEREKGNE